MKETTTAGYPRLFLKFLRWFCDPQLLEDVEGDLIELHNSRSNISPRSAKALFAKDVLQLFRPGIIRIFSINYFINNNNMLRNHFTTAIRNGLKNKGYTAINLLGLVVGLASSILILLWVQDEVEKDEFHTKSDRTYQIWRNMYQASGEINTTPGIPQPLQHVLNDEYPDVDEVTLLGWEMESLLSVDDESSFEIGRYASPEFFSMFSYPVILGDPKTAFKDLHAIAISERLAAKYFGDNWKDNVLGKAFMVDHRQEFIIAAVFENPGSNSSLNFDWIMPAKEHISRSRWVESWYNGGYRMYVTLDDPSSLESTMAKMEQEINTHTNHEADERLLLQKYSETYLYSNFNNGRPEGGRIRYVQMLSVMAIFLLVIAAINFMNLFAAQANKRLKEIGIRKVIGAPKSSIRVQFYVESFLLSAIAVVVALAVVYLAFPYFNNLTGKTLSLNFADPQLWVGLLLITGFTGLLAGSYPALSLPGFKISNALKGGVKNAALGGYIRSGLVVFQFALSFLLIVGTLVVSQQMDYIFTKNLGLDRENMVFLQTDGELEGKNELFKSALLNIPEVKDVTFTSGNPISYGSSTSGASWEGKNPDDVVEINVLTVDLGFTETMGMNLAQGRDFSKDLVTDTSKFLINQVLADIMGFENPIDQPLYVWGMNGSVVGVVEDFHMSSMYEPIQPLIIRYDPDGTEVAFIRTQMNTVAALQGIEDVTKSLNPSFPFQYEFLDDDYKESYQSEMTLSTLANIFAIVSVFISCLGLFGIASFSADQRSKEIGVRKVLGANVATVVLMLSKHYAILMAAAIVIAIPVAYYYMETWLAKFTFRIELGIAIFVLAACLSFLIGFITVSYKAYRAATINPIRTLKDE